MASELPAGQDVRALAARHGLDLEPGSVRFEEAGLDYRVAFAAASGTGEPWVLRIPRRPDVAAKVAEERRILDFVRPRLPVAVPDWRIAGPDLVAYPLLPGRPGLTLDPAGQPVWHYDTASPEYARSLAEVVASLHRLDPAAAAAAGVPAETPDEVRRRWAADLERVLGQFDVAAELAARWRAWLDDDGLWPRSTVLTHGEIYPAHLLLDDSGRVLSVLDWTTAGVGDPVLDLVHQYLIAPPGSFAVTVRAYEELTGRHEPRLADRCEALLAAGPLGYALFALASGAPEHRAAAAAQLRP
ncbi:macrolide 2'-phosphotransferase [Kocuria sp. NPDC057446]|uniref:macrolide 2'-phosphotransferase n=1 Tax=Kocuria sp. NPDC057446 TaxID=3346137 RepID=UPI0036799910